MLRFALFSPPDEGPPLFKDHLCVNHRVVSQEEDYCTNALHDIHNLCSVSGNIFSLSLGTLQLVITLAKEFGIQVTLSKNTKMFDWL